MDSPSKEAFFSFLPFPFPPLPPFLHFHFRTSQSHFSPLPLQRPSFLATSPSPFTLTIDYLSRTPAVRRNVSMNMYINAQRIEFDLDSPFNWPRMTEGRKLGVRLY